MTGQKIGKLLVLSFAGFNKFRRASWNCVCDCGKKCVRDGNAMRTKNTESCGCGKFQFTGKEGRVHGGARTTEYHIWRNMKTRCANPKNSGFPYYGGRGIRVCEKWEKSFVAFLQDVGHRPSPKHSLDRIDNSGHYEPKNVRWSLAGEQMRNRRKFCALATYSDEEIHQEFIKRGLDANNAV